MDETLTISVVPNNINRIVADSIRKLGKIHIVM